MKNEYLRAFVIGSSFFVFFPYFFSVSKLKEYKKINYDYVSYSFIAPIALGLMNVVSLYLANEFNFSKINRFLFMSLFAPTIVLIFVSVFGVYNFSSKDWLQYIVGLYVLYFIIWNFVIYSLDKYV